MKKQLEWFVYICSGLIMYPIFFLLGMFIDDNIKYID